MELGWNAGNLAPGASHLTRTLNLEACGEVLVGGLSFSPLGAPPFTWISAPPLSVCMFVHACVYKREKCQLTSEDGSLWTSEWAQPRWMGWRQARIRPIPPEAGRAPAGTSEKVENKSFHTASL